jgi:phage internal scaffolding protein
MAKTFYEEQSAACEHQDAFHRARSKAHYTENTEETKTKQSDAFDSDINNIVKRFTPTEQAIAFATRPGEYLDLSGAPDFHRALLIIDQANEDFAALPAEVRTAFNNDPAQLIDAIYDPKRVDELTKLGIFAKVESAPEPKAAATTEPAKTTNAPTNPPKAA